MKQFNNKILIIILLVLVAAFALTRLFRAPALQSNLDEDAISVDTSEIDRITLQPIVEKESQFTLQKENNRWRVTQGKISSPANTGLVQNLLGKLSALKAERIVTRKEEKWNEYKVGDSTGTTVILHSDGKEHSRFIVGKENRGNTFLRKFNDEAVYAMEGSFASAFNQTFTDWRDQTLIQLKPDSIRQIDFVYPADSGFVLAKRDKQWIINEIDADSAKVAKYLNTLRNVEINGFADDFKPDGKPDIEVTITSEHNSAKIKGWKKSFAEWVFNSDHQPDVFFMDKGNLVAEKLLPSKKAF